MGLSVCLCTCAQSSGQNPWFSNQDVKLYLECRCENHLTSPIGPSSVRGVSATIWFALPYSWSIQLFITVIRCLVRRGSLPIPLPLAVRVASSLLNQSPVLALTECVKFSAHNQRRHNGQLSKAILVINLISTYRICSSSLRAPYIRPKWTHQHTTDHSWLHALSWSFGTFSQTCQSSSRCG